ncbi:MAG: DUF4905 domain-containing protein [Candidatus Thermochlorobacter aerophilum]|jgi:hypothetical protein|uniref:DUF4905 domain-containing protein n=1 Tax=Candidatus Thermochlorobacter aerophilus TaxID=1868324 RepID=A0A395M481_9BACT|nr:MAG: DUF4905 domain-containing protein [Candidatus Thermochlorobacter aerophilum]RFM25521.1 MAG: DUF4905 domain-containing protein [Candidatus Thermochlorobacter aerophilum]
MFGLLRKRLKPLWQFGKPHGWIWRALFVGDDYLLCEFRQSTQRKASFFLLDNRTGTLIWDDFILTDTVSQKPIGDGWWVGMETAYHGLVYFHGYYSPNIPEHLGIWAIEPLTRTLKWARPDLGYLCIVHNKMVALRNIMVEGYAERAFLTLDPMTGEMLEDFGQNATTVNALRQQAPSLLAEQEVVLPEHLTDSSSEFMQATNLVRMVAPHARIIGGLDILPHQDKIILGYHEQTNQMVSTPAGTKVLGLNYHLFVFDHQRHVVYSDLLGTQMSGLLVDGFFVRHHRLYYVKERNMLFAIDLS